MAEQESGQDLERFYSFPVCSGRDPHGGGSEKR